MKNSILEAAKGTNMIWKWLGRRGPIYESLMRLFYGLDIIALTNICEYIYTEIFMKQSWNLSNYYTEIFEKNVSGMLHLGKAKHSFIHFGWTKMTLLPGLFPVEKEFSTASMIWDLRGAQKTTGNRTFQQSPFSFPS